jgi:hypothetical protein
MNYKACKLVALVLGLTTAALGMFGAFEFAKGLEGGTITYLVIASPVIAAAAAMIPPIAEASWHNGHRLKSVLWWLVLAPCAAVVFFSSAERVFVAKSGAQAERAALHSAVDRAKADLVTVKAEAKDATAKADKVRGLQGRSCGSRCQSIRASGTTALDRVTETEGKLLTAEKLAHAEAPLTPPSWLLPASLDLVSFASIWTALAAPVRSKPVQKKRRRRTARKKSPPASPAKVVPLRKAAS